MNTKYFKILAFASLLLIVFSGCAKDEPVDPDLNGNGNGRFISFSMELGSKKTSRTLVGMESLKPTEDMVYEVKVVFYSVATDKVMKVVNMDASNVDDPLNPTTIVPFHGTDVAKADPNGWGFISYAIEFTDAELAEGEYYMLMIVNPNPDIDAKTNMGSSFTLTDLENEVLDYNEQEMIGVGKNRFIMLNYTGKILLTRKANFWKTKELAEKNPVNNYLGRNVSIVFPIVASGSRERSVSDLEVYFDNGSYYQVQNATWNIDVVNRKMYWMRRPLAGEDLINETHRIYGIDPNYINLSQKTGGTQQQREENFVYLTKQDVDNGYPLVSNADINGPEDMTYCYIPENTMNGDEQYGDVMTSVVIGLNLVIDDNPTRSLSLTHLFNFKSGEFASRGPYSPTSINELPFSNFFELFYSVLFDPTVWNPHSNKFLKTPQIFIDLGMPEDYLPEMELNMPPVYNSLKYLMDNYGYTGTGEPDWDSMESFETDDFIFYKEGRMYYTIPVSHLGLTESIPGMTGRYGVLRNNAYILGIESLIGPGSIYPERPLVPKGETPFMIVLPWEEIKNNFDFGMVP